MKAAAGGSKANQKANNRRGSIGARSSIGAAVNRGGGQLVKNPPKSTKKKTSAVIEMPSGLVVTTNMYQKGLYDFVAAFRALQAKGPVSSAVQVDACTEYTRLATLNPSLVCADTLLARSGVEYQRRMRPRDTSDKPGWAKLRILDSFSLTSGKDACSFTAVSDGRHFHALDPLHLRALAEGVLGVLGDQSGSSPPQSRPSPPEPARPAPVPLLEVGDKGANNSRATGDVEEPGLLVSAARVRHLARSLEFGNGTSALLKRAFNNRAVTLVGDSTSLSLFKALVAWTRAPPAIATRLNALHHVPVTRVIQADGSATAQVVLAQVRVRPGDQHQADYLAGLDPSGFTNPATFRVENNTTLSFFNDVNLIFDAGRVVRDLVAVEAAAAAAEGKKKKKKKTRGAAGVDGGGGRLPQQRIVVVNAGLHLLQVFPERLFGGTAGLTLMSYRNATEDALDALRAHVGEGGLVVWRTTNNVCDDMYSGAYADIVGRTKEQNQKHNNISL